LDVEISSAFITMLVVQIVFVIVFPIVVAVLVRRWLKVGWRYFWIGALIFFLSQVITRVPAVQVIQAQIAPQLQASPTLLWGWLVVLALTAGLFEEVGRYLGYRFLMKPEERIWPRIVMFGIGHGGLESMLLVGALGALTLVNLLVLTGGALETLPPEQRALATQQLAAIAEQPTWTPLLGAWERVSAMAWHVGLSVVVLQVFRRHSLVWLWLAIAAHAGGNFLVVAIPQILGRDIGVLVGVELVVTLLAVVALWVAWRLRDTPVPPLGDDEAARSAPTLKISD
jgi:uncharacterized membrane protein YhfC